MKSTKKSRFHVLAIAILFASLLGGVVTVTPVHAAGIIVNSNTDTVANDGVCTLREAITAANTDTASGAALGECPAGSGADTITFAANYTITLAGDQLPVVITQITINGNGSTNTRIRANATPFTATYRVFQVSGSGNLALNNLSVRNGQCIGGCTTAGYHGGGILNYGTLTVTNSWLSLNLASYFGGGIYNSGTLTVTNSMFENGNYAYYGGGIYNSGGSVIVTNSTLWLNSAAYGGGIHNFDGTLTVTNSTLTENFASNQGGGIYNDSNSVLSVTNSTLSANNAPNAGGIGGIYNASALNFSNTIIANSSGGDCENGSGGTISTNVNNLVEDGSCSASLSGDPNLGILDDGGPTWIYPLLAGSPAIDAGDDTTCANPPVGNLDQRGVTRPQGAHCDIGAYELEISFVDVPASHWAWQYIESLYNAGITGGCGGGNYCPDNQVTRAQMAVFLLRGIHGSSYTPPAATGTVFNDVGAGDFAAAWIEQMVSEGITSGCGGGNYCPNATVTRAQMAVFLLRAKYGSGYTPPAATGTVFSDVPLGSFGAAWIEQMVSEGITSGCGGGNYCPNQAVTRAQMAVFLVRIFNLP